MTLTRSQEFQNAIYFLYLIQRYSNLCLIRHLYMRQGTTYKVSLKLFKILFEPFLATRFEIIYRLILQLEN